MAGGQCAVGRRDSLKALRAAAMLTIILARGG
jgi:hypothetical protein